MNVNRKLAVACAAGLLCVSGGALGQMTTFGHPPVGLTTWTVFSCILPEQAPLCIVPVKVKLDGTGKCQFDVAQFIEFDSARTRRIRWDLQSVDPVATRDFRFGHTVATKKGIEFTLDLNGDFTDDGGATGTRIGKKLRRAGALARARLFHYDINVEWLDAPGAVPMACEPHGPAIINRGR